MKDNFKQGISYASGKFDAEKKFYDDGRLYTKEDLDKARKEGYENGYSEGEAFGIWDTERKLAKNDA